MGGLLIKAEVIATYKQRHIPAKQKRPLFFPSKKETDLRDPDSGKLRKHLLGHILASPQELKAIYGVLT